MSPCPIQATRPERTTDFMHYTLNVRLTAAVEIGRTNTTDRGDHFVFLHLKTDSADCAGQSLEFTQHLCYWQKFTDVSEVFASIISGISPHRRKYLWNVGNLLPHQTALQSRRQPSLLSSQVNEMTRKETWLLRRNSWDLPLCHKDSYRLPNTLVLT
jgi:hypothetical protein